VRFSFCVHVQISSQYYGSMVRITIYRQFQELLALCKYSHCIYTAQLKIAYIRLLWVTSLRENGVSEGSRLEIFPPRDLLRCCVIPCTHPTYAEKHIPGNRGTAQSRSVLMIFKEKEKKHRMELNPISEYNHAAFSLH